jgi:rifampicin phosphotransferase
LEQFDQQQNVFQWMSEIIMKPYVIQAASFSAEERLANEHVEIGGKARNLFILQKNGLPVPEFFCVSSAAFADTLAPVLGDIAQLLRACDDTDFDSLSNAAVAIGKHIQACEFSADLRAQIATALTTLPNNTSLSVRSSAANEDGLKSSFAGQLSTFLHVSPAQVEDKIKACWASAFEPGILTYMKKIGRDPLGNPLSNGVSVVVQRMVPAESAGVLFQADPQGEINKLVIAAGYGLGEGVVADKVETDLYYYNKLTREWQLGINRKLRRLGYAETGGTEEFAVPAQDQDRAVLSDTQRQTLLQSSDLIAGIYPHFQDIEWAFDASGKLFILQARPITTIPQGFARVFDNSNIIESYPVVVSPMTFSVLHLDYHHCIKDALIRFGAPASVVEKREDQLQHMVGYIQGRAYYHLSNWMHTLLVVPFFKRKIVHAFEQMIGTDSSAHTDHPEQMDFTAWETLQLNVRFPLFFVKNLINHGRLIKQYFQITGEIRREFESIDLATQSSDQLIGYLHHFAHRFMTSMGIPILNDFFAMIFMAATRQLFAKSNIPDAENLLNQLLSNQHIESTKPVLSLNALAAKVKQDAALLLQLEQLQKNPARNDPASILQQLQQQGYGEFASQLRTHLDLYGHRSPKELIMEADTFRENPFALLHIIVESSKSQYVAQPQQQDLNAVFEAQVQNARHKRLLRWLLNKTRATVASREATRLDRGLHFSFFRTLLHRLGARMVEEDLLNDARDVFCFTLQELDDWRKGCSPNQDLRALVAYRKQQIQEWQQQDPAEKLFLNGSVYANRIAEKQRQFDATALHLSGTGCSSGVITAPAAIVRNPSATTDIKGKVLVSETTDPGWVFLMVISAGLVSERGSLLSHTAIIGRELGIPTIVGVKNATCAIQEGDSITINGKTGDIQIHREPSVAAA